ncbi:MAG: hypothetical protein ACI4CT_05345 [Lachnospiraceae bacterium]
MKRFDGTEFEEVQNVNLYDGVNWIASQNGKRFDGVNWIDIYAPTDVQFIYENMSKWCAGTAYNGKTLTVDKQNEIGVRFFTFNKLNGDTSQINIGTNDYQWKNPWNDKIQSMVGMYSWMQYHGQYLLHDFTCNTLYINMGVDKEFGTLDGCAYHVEIYQMDDNGNVVEDSMIRFPESEDEFYNSPVVISDLGICEKQAKVVVDNTDNGLMLYGVSSYNE